MGICTFIFGGLLMKRVKDWIGEPRMLLFAIILLIASYLITPSLPTLASFYIFVIVFAAGNNFARPIVRSNLTRAVAEDQQGLISGYSTTASSIARIIAPLISSGWLQIGGLTLGGYALNEFVMIAATGALVGVLFLLLFVVDLKSGDRVGGVGSLGRMKRSGNWVKRRDVSAAFPSPRVQTRKPSNAPAQERTGGTIASPCFRGDL